MELKQAEALLKIEGQKVLIVLYGIETLKMAFHKEIICVLIVLYGIETVQEP